jgi:membrane fusion protein, copper/silver efflux system
MNNRSNIWIIACMVLIGGVLLGIWKTGDHHSHDAHEEHNESIYTCSMHPQIRQPHPGKCPLCAMDLVPLSTLGGGVDDDDYTYTLSKRASALLQVQTRPVRKGTFINKLEFPARLEYDATKTRNVTLPVSGRVEELLIRHPGQAIQKGQLLAKIYAPEWQTAQRELKESWKLRVEFPELYKAVKNRLLAWNLTQKQIQEALDVPHESPILNVYAAHSGLVIGVQMQKGDYVNKGSILGSIVSDNALQLVLDVWEQEVHQVKIGQQVEFVLPQNSSKHPAKVTAIAPNIDPAKRSVEVRADVLAKNVVGLQGGWVKATLMAQLHDALVVPQSAVLWSGKRSVVYVQESVGNPSRFTMREVVIGSSNGVDVVIQSGLEPYELVVVHGVFAIDAAAQLRGNFTLMNRPDRIDVSIALQAELDLTLSFYLKLKDALVQSDEVQSQDYSKQFLRHLQQVTIMHNDDAHRWWNGAREDLILWLAKMPSSPNLEAIRSNFAYVSQTMIQVGDVLGFSAGSLFVQYCPMALADVGAYWLSLAEYIRNPYFGDDMLECGDLVRRLRVGGEAKEEKLKTPVLHNH